MHHSRSFTMYDAELYDSDAYQSLSRPARNLFEFLLRERRYRGKGKKRQWLNNGEIKLNRIQFIKRYGNCIQTVNKARNQLITVGLIKLERIGGSGRGDMNEYSILYQCYPKKERWRDYPNKDWRHEIPQHKGKSLGKKWKKGESGNPKYKKKPSLSEQPLNGGKLSTKVAPTKPTSIYKDRHLNSVKTEVSE
mgnify:CR=1 FL=1